MPSDVRMVCFDLGGVIIRHYRSWKEACAGLGVEFRDGVDDPGLTARRRELTRLYHVGRLSCEEFFPALTHATGGRYTEAEVRRLHDGWIYAEYEGIDAVLRALVGVNGIETGILSNTNAAHWARLGRGERDGLPLFPAALTLNNRHASHLLGLAKPDVEIYRAFETQTGARGDGVLFFDDLPENIEAARSVGWRAELIDHTGDTAAQVTTLLARHNIQLAR